MEEEKKQIIRRALETLPFFPPLKEEEKDRIAEKFQLMDYPKDTVIFAKGDPGDFLYILNKGSVEVFIEEGESKKVLATLKAKDLFGEMALLTGEPRTANVVTKEDSQVVALNKKDFDEMLAASPTVAVNLTKMISRRLMHTAQATAEQERKEKEIVTIYSATGRCGKSTLAVSLSALLAKSYKNVLLMDFNFQFGHLGLMLNIKPELTIYDLAQKSSIEPELFAQHIKKTDYGFSLLFAPLHIAQAEVVEEQKVIEIIGIAREQFDALIIDTGVAITPPTLAALDHATKLLYLYEPDMFSLRDARECLEVMRELEYPDEKIFLVKRHITNAEQSLTNEKVKEFLQHEVQAELPEDASVQKIVSAAKIPTLENPRSAYAQAVRNVAGLIIGEAITAGESEPKKAGGLFKGFFGKK